MIDYTKPLQTVEGIPVTLIFTAGRNGDYPILVYIGESDVINAFSRDGEFIRGVHSINDLMNVPEKRVVYMNTYSRSSFCYDTRELADSYATTDRIACIRVEYTEGQFDQ